MNNKQTYIKAIEEEIDSAILLYNDVNGVNKCKKKVFELMEQYAQTKTLETLEPIAKLLAENKMQGGYSPDKLLSEFDKIRP